jgi:hypothetical protein
LHPTGGYMSKDTKVEHLLERQDIKDKIIDSLRRTKKNNLEYTFNFCPINDTIQTTEIEEGKEHMVGDVCTCPNCIKPIGAFHTHTHLTSNQDIVPSPRDIIKSLEEELNFFCIGANKDNIGITRCFDSNKLLSEMGQALKAAGLDINKENIEKTSKLMVYNMLQGKSFINRRSYTRLYGIKH